MKKAENGLKCIVIFVSMLILGVFCQGCKEQLPPGPNVLVILMDTLRADHLGVYGYELETSPHIDRFAEENQFLDPFYSVAPWTSPAIASLFTGMYPTSHGVLSHLSLNKEQPELYALPDSLTTLAERFQLQGYRTGAVSSNPWILSEFGFDQGFEQFIVLDNKAPAGEINAQAQQWLSELQDNESFFLYLHYMDCHGPYIPPSPYSQMLLPTLQGEHQRVIPEDIIPAYLDILQDGTTTLEYLISQYDGAIRYFDDQFGEMVQFLKEQGFYDDMVVLLTSDHGEEFMEHGRLDHGFTLYQEQLAVPLVCKFPQGTNAKLFQGERMPEIIDIYPTLLSSIGVEGPLEISGESLLAQGDRDAAFAEADKDLQSAAFIGKEYKYIRQLRENKASLYNLENDPSEQTDMLQGKTQEIDVKWDDMLFARIADAKQLAVKPEVAQLQDEVLEKLGSLGYTRPSSQTTGEKKSD